MKRLKINKLLTGIIICLVVLLSIQVYWIFNFTYWQRISFNKSINNALEKSIGDERKQRADSISSSIYNWMMDTSLTKITSTKNELYQTTTYHIEDQKGKYKQKNSFSLSYENRPVSTQNDSIKILIAKLISRKFQESYSDFQTIYYYTENIGDSASSLSNKLILDRFRIKNFLSNNLLKLKIKSSFSIYFVKISDSLSANMLNQKNISFTSLQTKFFKSDVFKNGESLYTYAVFDQPFYWLLNSLITPLLLSFLFMVGLATFLFYLYQIIKHQKKISDIKNDFIDNMTHELKTPITIISAAAEAIQEFGALNDSERTKKYLTNIRNNSEQLHKIIDKILGISAFENQSITLVKTKFSLGEIIKEIEQQHTFLLSNVEIKINIFPQCDILYADQFHFKNIFFNLLDNAIKYNDKSKTHIWISTKESVDVNTIIFEDNGPGIDSKYLDSIFDKFFRIPFGNIQYAKGFGLGLFYVKRIVDLHGGTIRVETKLGCKTCFSIELPKSP